MGHLEICILNLIIIYNFPETVYYLFGDGYILIPGRHHIQTRVLAFALGLPGFFTPAGLFKAAAGFFIALLTALAALTTGGI